MSDSGMSRHYYEGTRGPFILVIGTPKVLTYHMYRSNPFRRPKPPPSASKSREDHSTQTNTRRLKT
eukprot:5567858-Amphidinium_carterae.1